MHAPSPDGRRAAPRRSAESGASAEGGCNSAAPLRVVAAGGAAEGSRTAAVQVENVTVRLHVRRLHLQSHSHKSGRAKFVW